MKALLINAVCGILSTGNICIDIAHDLEEKGYEVKIAYGREACPSEFSDYAIRIGNKLDVYSHALLSKVLDSRGFGSKYATRKFLKWADDFDPDLLWLHNLHDYYINIEMLFTWIKARPKMLVKWTQHDCWAITGGCMHFEMSRCEQWKTGCRKCDKKLLNYRPLIYNTVRNYKKKKELFSNISNMEIIAPSKWLANIFADSFLGKYKISVRHNTIDATVFKPTSSDFRKEHALEDRFIILGVASAWSKAKGLYDYYELAGMLDNNYKVILVGLTDKQLSELPSKILGIKKTNSKQELAEIYTAADVFLNLTYQDTYPTVNLEAQSCGTPVITYNTGGSPESVPVRNVIEQGNLQQVFEVLTSRNYETAVINGTKDERNII